MSDEDYEMSDEEIDILRRSLIMGTPLFISPFAAASAFSGSSADNFSRVKTGNYSGRVIVDKVDGRYSETYDIDDGEHFEIPSNGTYELEVTSDDDREWIEEFDVEKGSNVTLEPAN